MAGENLESGRFVKRPGSLVARADFQANPVCPGAGEHREGSFEEPATATHSLQLGFDGEVLDVAEAIPPDRDRFGDDVSGDFLADLTPLGVFEDEKSRRIEEGFERREVPRAIKRALLDADDPEQVRPLDAAEPATRLGIVDRHSRGEGPALEEGHGGHSARTERVMARGLWSTSMFRSGGFVADQLGDLDPEQVQPNGVDLRLDAVLELVEPGSITRAGTTIGERGPLPTVALGAGEEDDPPEGYRLDPGGYILQYAETVSIPEDHVGFVLPRSSLMRNGAMLNTAVWDAGYTGRGEGLLQVHHDLTLERGARVAQLVLASADHDGVYDGSYQGERLDRA